MKTKDVPKYRYPEAIRIPDRTWPDKQITVAPLWCSVDLRDGNQALPVPMSPELKLEYFKMLVEIGFKDIEVGFPSASQDDFDFCRRLIEEGHIPGDVRISVLTQARRHLIERTVEALKGVGKGLLHCYVATSDLHGRLVFNRGRAEVRTMAVDATTIIAQSIEAAGLSGKVGYEFSPEEFTDSDLDFVIDLCEGVCEAWNGERKEDFILNLPATVERRPPNHYADMIEYFRRHYRHGGRTTLSIHCHNDQGCAVAASEMALLAGAERVEGTLFGHGERTGNVDVATLALNLHSRGVDPGLNFSDMYRIVRVVEETSKIPVHPRHPYAGQLVFTAFSGSHQDAIRKGIESKLKAAEFFEQGWKVPYLHIDPADLGRKYEKLIRINSQSGKGGIAFVLENDFGINSPKSMHPEIGAVVQKVADERGGEISAAELLETFRANFVDVVGPFEIRAVSRVEEATLADPNHTRIKLDMLVRGEKLIAEGDGNGPISAAVHAMRDNQHVFDFTLECFTEQALGRGADAKAMAFIGIKRLSDGKMFHGVGEHSNIDQAAMLALVAAMNRAATVE